MILEISSDGNDLLFQITNKNKMRSYCYPSIAELLATLKAEDQDLYQWVKGIARGIAKDAVVKRISLLSVPEVMEKKSDPLSACVWVGEGVREDFNDLDNWYQGRKPKEGSVVGVEHYPPRTFFVQHIDEWQKEARRRFGINTHDWKFVCPRCGEVQSVGMCLDSGLHIDEVGVRCAGGFLAAERSNGKPLHGCRYFPNRFFNMNPIEVIQKDGSTQRVFAFAVTR